MNFAEILIVLGAALFVWYWGYCTSEYRRNCEESRFDPTKWHVKFLPGEYQVARKYITYKSSTGRYDEYAWETAATFHYKEHVEDESREKALTDAEEYLFTLKDGERRALEASLR